MRVQPPKPSRRGIRLFAGLERTGRKRALVSPIPPVDWRATPRRGDGAVQVDGTGTAVVVGVGGVGADCMAYPQNPIGSHLVLSGQCTPTILTQIMIKTPTCLT